MKLNPARQLWAHHAHGVGLAMILETNFTEPEMVKYMSSLLWVLSSPAEKHNPRRY